MRQTMNRDSVFHEIPTQIAAAHRNEDRSLGSVPTTQSVALFVSEIRSFWRKVMTFEVEVAEVPPRYAVFLTFLRAAKQMCSLFVVSR